jgi:hypothetical protein
MTKRSNLRIHEVKERAKIQTKGIKTFNETIAEMFPN